MDEKTLKEFAKWGKTPPSHDPHGSPEAIRENLKQLKPTEWKQKGNVLYGMTDMGELGVKIPTDYVLRGTDKKGLPILEKIDV